MSEINDSDMTEMMHILFVKFGFERLKPCIRSKSKQNGSYSVYNLSLLPLLLTRVDTTKKLTREEKYIRYLLCSDDTISCDTKRYIIGYRIHHLQYLCFKQLLHMMIIFLFLTLGFLFRFETIILTLFFMMLILVSFTTIFFINISLFRRQGL